MKIAIIGAGISGLSCASILNKYSDVEIFEKDDKPGGLIRCDSVNGGLYHKIGGHIFNSKNEEVLKWFWSFFDKEEEFIKSSRNAKILLHNQLIGYPIENHLYQMEQFLGEKIIADLLNQGSQDGGKSIHNFEDFLLQKFGETLFEIYFKPYNSKIWKTDLKNIPLDWLEGKLPMPEVKDIILSNIYRTAETNMVHSTFFYPKKMGSQFIADRLAKSLKIYFNVPISSIEYKSGSILINDEFVFDKVIYTGDIRLFSDIFHGEIPFKEYDLKTGFQSNSTSNVFCEADETDYSWLYLPERSIKSHRIIYTGNFSKNNNIQHDRTTCVVEFSGFLGKDDAFHEANKLPGNLKPLSWNFHDSTYVVQTAQTRQKVNQIKKAFAPYNIFFVGRFAEWEYYNMDKCIESAMRLTKQIIEER